jgi:hypothetical protein
MMSVGRYVEFRCAKIRYDEFRYAEGSYSECLYDN